MDWLDVVQQVGDAPFKVAMLFALVYGVRQLSRMREMMGKLHVQLAVVIERTSSHEKRITRLEKGTK